MGGVNGFLLDTHVLLWMLGQPERLTATARRLVADPSSDLVVSSATAWEIATKHRVGKLPDAERVLAGYQAHLRRLGVGTLSIGNEHALYGGALQWDHRDPFDRILAAQAIIEGRALITADPAFASLDHLTVVW